MQHEVVQASPQHDRQLCKHFHPAAQHKVVQACLQHNPIVRPAIAGLCGVELPPAARAPLCPLLCVAAMLKRVPPPGPGQAGVASPYPGPGRHWNLGEPDPRNFSHLRYVLETSKLPNFPWRNVLHSSFALKFCMGMQRERQGGPPAVFFAVFLRGVSVTPKVLNYHTTNRPKGLGGGLIRGLKWHFEFRRGQNPGWVVAALEVPSSFQRDDAMPPVNAIAVLGVSKVVFSKVEF